MSHVDCGRRGRAESFATVGALATAQSFCICRSSLPSGSQRAGRVRHHRAFTGVRAVGVVLMLLSAGCATGLREDPPGPDRSRLGELRLSVRSTTSGCPVQATVRFADPHGDVVRADLAWSHSRGSRRVGSGVIGMPIPSAEFAGKMEGAATATLMFLHDGDYWLAAQVVDSAGRLSNVETRFLVVYEQRRPPTPCGPPDITGG